MTERYFLIRYDVARQALIEAHDLGSDAATAATVYADREREGCGSDVEIVLLGADSLATLRRTHAHYFDDGAASAREFERLLIGAIDPT